MMNDLEVTASENSLALVASLRSALGLAENESPFPWQEKLLRQFINGDSDVSVIDIPTGLGKTSVMAIWLVAKAFGAKLPRRLVYVVDRRAVVDQATEEAESLQKWVAEDQRVAESLGLGDRPLPISTLRGQHVDNRAWLEDPSSPAIIVGTVDMIGSRLLFSGYGVSSRMRPYHAGLLGADTLVVLDEAHLVPAFEDLLRQIELGSDSYGPSEPSLRERIPAFKLLSLSATGRFVSGKSLTLSDGDRNHPVVARRLSAKKTLSVIDLGKITKGTATTASNDQEDESHESTAKNKGPKLSDVLADQAWQIAKQRGNVRCLVFCNAREDALTVSARLHDLAKSAGEAEPTIELFVGARRVLERTMVANWLVNHGFVEREDGTRATPDRPTFLIATSAGEVGVDMDADHMVCDLVAWERMVQRLGRANRRGDGDAKVVVVVDKEPAPSNAKAQAALSEKIAKRDAWIQAVSDRPQLRTEVKQVEKGGQTENREISALRNDLNALDEQIAAIKAEKKALPKGKKENPQDLARRDALQIAEKSLDENRKVTKERLKADGKSAKEQFKLDRTQRIAHFKGLLTDCNNRIKAFKDSDAKAVAQHEAGVAQHRSLRKLLGIVENNGGSLSPAALLELRNRQELAEVIRAATSVEPLRPALTRPLVEAWSMTSLDEHPGRPEIGPWLRGFRPDDPPQTVVVWRRHLPVPVDGPFDVKAAKRFFEAAPPHTSEQLETETYRVLEWLIERAAKVSAPTGEADLNANQVVVIALGLRGEPKAWRTLGELAAAKSKGKNENKEAKKTRDQAIEKLKSIIAGATLIVDARLGGLNDGLLDEKSSGAASADDSSTSWLARPDIADVPVTGFRIRALDSTGEDKVDWRTTPEVGWVRRNLFVVKKDLDGEPRSALTIDGWSGDAADEEDRSEADQPQQLAEHENCVEANVRQIAERLGIETKFTELLALCARLHDEGKRAPGWQDAFNAPTEGRPYAKTKGPICRSLLDGYRHEFGSLRYVLESGDFKRLDADEQEFVLHLVAAHHGYARPIIGTSGRDLPPPSITEDWARDVAIRFAKLSRRWGPWGLAWWEAVLRAADQIASRSKQHTGTADEEQRK